MQFNGSMESASPTMVWRVWAPSCCKFFVWLLLQNRVWTADRLLQREWPNQYFCPLCYRNLETTDHLMTECPISRIIWKQVRSFYGSGRRAGFWTKFLSEWFSELAGSSSSTKAKGARSLIILVCWSIWREHNARIFVGQEKGEASLISEIKYEAQLWASAGANLLCKSA